MGNKKSYFNRRYFILLTVCIVTGFIIGFSYNLSKDKRDRGEVSSTVYEEENNYRKQLIAQQERNLELSKQLNELESKIRNYEQNLSSDETAYENMLMKVNDLRLLLGEVEAKGEGIKIQLEDGLYDPTLTNPNDYIIHESHIFMLINELKIAGAEGIAINGQRLKVNSYIVCNGPVITIDGKQFPAPFVIEAIGNSNTLEKAIELSGGIVDQLLNDKINVTIEKKDHIVLSTVND